MSTYPNWFALLAAMLVSLPAHAQVAVTAKTDGNFAGTVIRDQATIFSSPARIHKTDWKWLIPAAGATAALFATDSRTMQDRIHSDQGVIDRSRQFSAISLGSLAAMPLYLGWTGWRNRDPYKEETSRLAARAVIDSLAAGEMLRFAVRRDISTTGASKFFSSRPTASSFGSLPATSAWAVASVMTRRYPGWLMKLAAYGLAGGVSASGVIGKQHAPSDIFISSGLGLLIGRLVSGESRSSSFDRHFGFDIPKSGTPRTTTAADTSPERSATGSVYVPMSSWIYPALDRLAAMGLVPSQISGLRPWTRAECRRQMFEAQDRLEKSGRSAIDREAANLVDLLHGELDKRDSGVVLESVYVREGAISGPVLNDSFHFGQTWSNDLGRPFGTGWNSYTGFTARAASGRFFAYVTGEYQHAPGTDPYPLGVRQTVAALDGIPLQTGGSGLATNRFRLLDTYLGARIGDLEISVGKQSLWWGPTADAPFSFSTNAEPTKNLRLSTVAPIRLPGFLKHLGEIRGEFLLGKLGGQMYTWRPWFNAQKLTFKLTDNLELGFTRWSILWGVGHPITAGSLLHNFTSTYSPDNGVGRLDPGDRKGGFDFRYRIPGLRNWLTVYSDSYCDDDPSPLAAPRRAALNPGIYLSHFPGIPKLDFRLEAPSTIPMNGDMGGMFIYFNSQYRSGNTNYGILLGNSVGRDARAVQATTTYWFTARRKIEAGYRQTKGGTKFLPGGLTQSDATLGGSYQFAPQWESSLTLQYERFWVPILGGPRHNLSATLQLTWLPNLQLTK